VASSEARYRDGEYRIDAGSCAGEGERCPIGKKCLGWLSMVFCVR